MISLTVEIVAHQKRLEMAEQLAEKVKADGVWLDSGFLGEWKNHQRALQSAADSNKSHAVILQDDAIVVNEFRDHVQAAIEKKPNEVISLYVGTYRPWKEEVSAAVKLAEENHASWLFASTVLWGVGLVIPVPAINECLDFCKRSKLPYDQRIGYWCEQTGRIVYYTWPSLVDHADTETVAHGGPQGKRVAHKFGVPGWNDTIVGIERPGSKLMLASNKDKTNVTNRLDTPVEML